MQIILLSCLFFFFKYNLNVDGLHTQNFISTFKYCWHFAHMINREINLLARAWLFRYGSHGRQSSDIYKIYNRLGWTFCNLIQINSKTSAYNRLFIILIISFNQNKTKKNQFFDLENLDKKK